MYNDCLNNDCFTDEPTLIEEKPILLGVIGSRTDADQTKLIDTILMPLLQEIGKPPEKLILPEEGLSSIFLSDWAESLKIPHQIYQADWFKHQRRAKIFRDSRIQEESNHFLIFLNKRSEFNEKLATRLARKGNRVFTVTYSDWSLEELIVRQEPLPNLQKPPVSTGARRGRKPGTGKVQASRQLMQLEDPGNQPRLTDLWVA
jgi:hypothetical protein